MPGSTYKISLKVSFCAIGWEAAVAAQDNVDDLRGILISLGPQLVSLLIVLVLPLFVRLRERCFEKLAEADALKECVLGL
jgi:hypothetical protein